MVLLQEVLFAGSAASRLQQVLKTSRGLSHYLHNGIPCHRIYTATRSAFWPDPRDVDSIEPLAKIRRKLAACSGSLAGAL